MHESGRRSPLELPATERDGAGNWQLARNKLLWDEKEASELRTNAPIWKRSDTPLAMQWVAKMGDGGSVGCIARWLAETD